MGRSRKNADEMDEYSEDPFRFLETDPAPVPQEKDEVEALELGGDRRDRFSRLNDEDLFRNRDF